MKHLPASCRVLSQPRIVAQALEHYLKRHSHYLDADCSDAGLTLLTTGDVLQIEDSLVFAWPDRPEFKAL